MLPWDIYDVLMASDYSDMMGFYSVETLWYEQYYVDDKATCAVTFHK